MLAVISDLHLQHVSGDVLHYWDGKALVAAGVRRNVLATALRRLFAMLIASARRLRSERIDIVLAGDIFELHRSPHWLYNSMELRPFGAPLGGENDSPAENPLLRCVLEILDRIEANNHEFFAVLRRFVANRNVHLEGQTLTLKGSTVRDVRVHFIPGNHDRLANAWVAARRRIRWLLGLPEDDGPFPNRLEDPIFGDLYGVRVRHGHEMDATTFSRPPGKDALEADLAAHLAPALGDYVTVDFATRLALAFRARYAQVLRRPDERGRHYRDLYAALTEFDDVRPPSLVVDYLLQGFGASDEKTFEILRPILRDAVETALREPFFVNEVKRLGYWSRPMAEAVRQGLKHLPARALASLTRSILRSRQTEGESPARLAREEAGLGASVHLVIAGHTHQPEQVPLRASPTGTAYYVNTGTWRTILPFGEETFGRLRAYTVVFCYSERERQLGDGRRLETWTGALVQEKYGPFHDVEEASKEPNTQELRFLHLAVEKTDERRAELRMHFGVDGTSRSASFDGVREGTKLEFGSISPIPLDAGLDGELWFHGLEADSGLPLDPDDPLPWALMPLARKHATPRSPFRQGPGELLIAGWGPFRFRLHYRVGARS
ncbi:MAG: hypothetical protein AB1486_10245 [Planctomycetota bacterium]